jgi:hypothetical protein
MKTRADLKPGDAVTVAHYGALRKATVFRVTKTQITLDDGTRWLVSTGRRVNAPRWDVSAVEPFDAAKWSAYQAEAERQLACNALVQRFATVCNRLTSDQIARVAAVLDEVGK